MENEEIAIDCYGFEARVYETGYLVVDLLVYENYGKWSDAPDCHVAGDVGHDFVMLETARAECGVLDTVLEDSVS